MSRVSELTSIAVFTMKRGKEPQCKRMYLGNGFRIEEVDRMGYKYLELVEKDRTCQEYMKTIVRKKILNKLRSYLSQNSVQSSHQSQV